MAEKKLYLGTWGAYFYDDASLIDDGDGDFPGDTRHALSTDGQLHVETAPTDGHHVVRLMDVGMGGASWIKMPVDSITLDAGVSSDAAADLEDFYDGNIYHIDEEAATPGIDLKVDFVDVTAFSWIRIRAQYDGNHWVSIQLYDWANTAWVPHTRALSHTGTGSEMDNLDFFIPAYADFIGTGGNLGDVRVRFYQGDAGDANDDLDIDLVALYK